jgi:VPDSG-CTERM motif
MDLSITGKVPAGEVDVIALVTTDLGPSLNGSWTSTFSGSGPVTGLVGIGNPANSQNSFNLLAGAATMFPPLTTLSGPFSAGFPYSLIIYDVVDNSASDLPAQVGSDHFLQITTPDGGMTLALLGFALAGFEGLRRKISK